MNSGNLTPNAQFFLKHLMSSTSSSHEKRKLLIWLLIPLLTMLASACADSDNQDESGNFMSLPQAYESKAPLPQVMVDGNRFILAKSKDDIHFRGVSIADPAALSERGHWNREFFEEIAAWNANVVRIPIHPRDWRRLGGDSYLTMLDQAVDWCEELDLYIIIDWHTIGNVLTGVYHRSGYVTSRDETYRFWYIIAHRYRNNPTVAMYELYNEPTNRGGRMGPLDWEDYATFLEGIISMLYAIDDSKIPLVAGMNYGYSLTDVKDRPINFPGIAYVTHPYPQKRPEPWLDDWQKDWGYVADTYPMICTEFGFMSEDDPGAHNPCIADERYGETIIDFFEERGISWTVWCFDPHWPPTMFKDWDYTPTRQGTFFRKKMEELNK